MECSVGTVTSRLSMARGKIKQGVMEYESINGEKLYSVSGIPLLTALFLAETKNLVVPNVLTKITGAALTSSFAIGGSATMTTKVISTASSAAASATNGVTAATAGVSTASVAAKTGIGALLGTAKAKIIAGVTSLAVIGGVAVGAFMLSKDKTPEPEPIYESEYISVEYVDAGYDDCNPGTNGNLTITLNIENKTDSELYVNQFYFSVNGMSYFNNFEETTINTGENEITLNLPMYAMYEKGTINISSAEILYCIRTDEESITDCTEKALFTVEFDKTVTIDSITDFPDYDECEVIYSDDTIDFTSSMYYSSENEYAYIYNKSDKVLFTTYQDEYGRTTYHCILPHSYSLLLIGTYSVYFNGESPDTIESTAIIGVCNFMESNSHSDGSYMYTTDEFTYTIIKK